MLPTLNVLQSSKIVYRRLFRMEVLRLSVHLRRRIPVDVPPQLHLRRAKSQSSRKPRWKVLKRPKTAKILRQFRRWKYATKLVAFVRQCFGSRRTIFLQASSFCPIRWRRKQTVRLLWPPQRTLGWQWSLPILSSSLQILVPSYML